MFNLVGVLPLSDLVIARDVFPSHKNYFSRLPDPRWGNTVGCIDFGLMPES